MYVVASGFIMLFYSGADIPIHSKLVLSSPPLENSNLFYSLQCL